MRHQRITRSTMLGLAIAAIAVPTAQAGPAEDLRSPDARDAAQGRVATAAQPAQDLRSPDARDVVQGWSTVSAPGLAVVDGPEVPAAMASPSRGGIDWADAGVGAGGMLVVVLLTLGGTFGVLHRRHRDPAAGRSATPV